MSMAPKRGHSKINSPYMYIGPHPLYHNLTGYLADTKNKAPLTLMLWWLILPIQNNAKILKNHRNPGKWVLT